MVNESKCVVCNEPTTFYFGGTPVHPDCYEKKMNEQGQLGFIMEKC